MILGIAMYLTTVWLGIKSFESIENALEIPIVLEGQLTCRSSLKNQCQFLSLEF